MHRGEVKNTPRGNLWQPNLPSSERCGPLPAHELFRRQAYILGDLPQQRRRDVAALVDRNRRAPSVWVPELNVRTSLAHVAEA